MHAMHLGPSGSRFAVPRWSNLGPRPKKGSWPSKTCATSCPVQNYVRSEPTNTHSMIKRIMAVSMHRHPRNRVTSQHASRSRDNMIDIMYRMRTWPSYLCWTIFYRQMHVGRGSIPFSGSVQLRRGGLLVISGSDQKPTSQRSTRRLWSHTWLTFSISDRHRPDPHRMSSMRHDTIMSWALVVLSCWLH